MAELSDAERHARAQGYWALVAVQFCFGLFPVFGIWAMRDFAPRAVAGWRIAAGAACLLTVAFARHGRAAWPRRADWARLQVCSLFGVVINMVLFLEGLERSNAVNAGLIMQTIPVFTFVIAVLLRQEAFVAARGFGIFVGLCGTVLLATQKGPEFSSTTVTGNLLMVTNACFYSFYLVLARPLLGRYPPLVVVAWVFALATWSLPLVAWNVVWVPAAAGARSWASLAYTLAFPTVIAYMLNAYALARVSASTTAVFIYMQAFITGIAAVVLLNEPLTGRTLFSGALIFAGTWMVMRRPVARPLAARVP